MAFHWQTFKTRALTAILFVVIMLAGLLWNKWSFLALFSIIHFGCWIEYQKIICLIDSTYKNINPFHKYGVMIGGYGLMLFFTTGWLQAPASLNLIGSILMLTGFLIVFISELLFSKQHQLKNISYSIFGLLYISLSWALLMHLRSDSLFNLNSMVDDFSNITTLLTKLCGYTVPIIIVASIWINDTMAYIVGSFIGKTALSSISPKKTWEGTIGGVILAVAAIWGLGFACNSSSPEIWAAIAFIAAVVGTLGDLLESKLKRLANVKDSGSLMPGHGGFLDRFDSLLLAIPFVWLFLKLFIL